MNKQELVRAFAIATVALLGLLLSTSIALASVPKANCGPHDRTESGLQGETTQEERFSGDSELGYNCNLELVGQQPQGAFEGAFSQDGPAYSDHCAYYGTDRCYSSAAAPRRQGDRCLRPPASAGERVPGRQSRGAATRTRL